MCRAVVKRQQRRLQHELDQPTRVQIWFISDKYPRSCYYSAGAVAASVGVPALARVTLV